MVTASIGNGVHLAYLQNFTTICYVLEYPRTGKRPQAENISNLRKDVTQQKCRVWAVKLIGVATHLVGTLAMLFSLGTVSRDLPDPNQ